MDQRLASYAWRRSWHLPRSTRSTRSNPIEVKSWDRSVEGKCLPLGFIINLVYVSGAYSAACDFVLAMLPWPIIWNLQMKKKEKLGVGIAMSMGVLAGIMATIKTAHLDKLSTNDSYDAAHLTIFDTAEISVTIMAASIPAMRLLFRDLQSSTRNYYSQSGPQRSRPTIGNQDGNHSADKSQAGDIKDDRSDRGILSHDGAGL
ncbi:hypothetical protein OQA88_11946 [Cercophora sp. LCS_1]